MTTRLVPYLNFDGDCAEAMAFYRDVFGGELYVQTFGEAFPDTPVGLRERVMHARMSKGPIEIMASDTHPEHGAPLAPGNNVHLSLNGSDDAALRRWFSRLSEGGRVEMPLERQFWGDVFGSCVDPFGVRWMVNISAAEDA